MGGVLGGVHACLLVKLVLEGETIFVLCGSFEDAQCVGVEPVQDEKDLNARIGGVYEADILCEADFCPCGYLRRS